MINFENLNKILDQWNGSLRVGESSFLDHMVRFYNVPPTLCNISRASIMENHLLSLCERFAT